MMHLNVRSDFSVGESVLQAGNIPALAKANGFDTVALVDTMSVHGMVEFSNACKKQEIKPIIGTRLRVFKDPTYRKPSKASGLKEIPNPSFMPKVFAKSDEGIKSIYKVLTAGTSKDYFYYVSRVGIKELCDMKDVVVTTGDMFGLFYNKDWRVNLSLMKIAFGDDLYVELMPANTPLFDRINSIALKAAEEFGLKVIATYPALYADDKDYQTAEVLWSITNNTTMDSPWRPIQYLQDMCLKPVVSLSDRVNSSIERMEKFDGITSNHKLIASSYSSNCDELVSKCKFVYEKLDVCLPVMATNEFMTLGKKCIEGWKTRIMKPVLGYQPDPSLYPEYQSRLQYELSILKRMNFSGYFLLVEDLVNWSKSQGIFVGPGRGSSGGSLVAFLLGITEVDPIRFNLLFERFINPDRLDLPDADLDFMSSRRLEVVDYLKEKYGSDRVAGISNYSRLGAASAIRDTGRMFGLENSDMTVTKLVPKEHGQSFDMTAAADTVPEIDEFRCRFPVVWGHAIKLEGALRAFGQHAAGVVVAGEPITNRAVLETRGETAVVNWDKRVVEDLGLIKMDLLGLSTLDTLAIAKEYILDNHGVDVNYIDIPLEDPLVMKAFSEGDTTGVFQFTSGGMRKLLKEMASINQLNFEDIAAATALYRPGPMESGMMDTYVNIKKGYESPHYDHPNMVAALEATSGVIIYQEQTMRVAVDLCGFTNTEADHLRKAMGKKDKDKMAKMKDQFVDGAQAGNIEITLEDGRVMKFHRLYKVRVKEQPNPVSIEDAYKNGWDVIL